MSKEKIVFKKKVIIPNAYNQQYPRVRVEHDVYQQICKISLETGETLNFVTSRLLEFAIERVEISEEQVMPKYNGGKGGVHRECENQ